MGEDDGPKTAAQRELDSELQVSVLHLSTVATYGCTLTTLRGPLSPTAGYEGIFGHREPESRYFICKTPIRPYGIAYHTAYGSSTSGSCTSSGFRVQS